MQTKKYEDCRAAVRFELYKFVQLEILRKECGGRSASVQMCFGTLF